MSHNKKDFLQGLTHFGSLLKEAMRPHKEAMTEVTLVARHLDDIKGQSKNVQTPKVNLKSQD